jgi:hypothetical protein
VSSVRKSGLCLLLSLATSLWLGNHAFASDYSCLRKSLIDLGLHDQVSDPQKLGLYPLNRDVTDDDLRDVANVLLRVDKLLDGQVKSPPKIFVMVEKRGNRALAFPEGRSWVKNPFTGGSFRADEPQGIAVQHEFVQTPNSPKATRYAEAAIVHEYSHLLFHQRLLETPALAEKLRQTETKLKKLQDMRAGSTDYFSDFEKEFGHPVRLVQHGFPELDARINRYKHTIAALKGYEELFADLVGVADAKDPDAIFGALSVPGGGFAKNKRARLRSFSRPISHQNIPSFRDYHETFFIARVYLGSVMVEPAFISTPGKAIKTVLETLMTEYEEQLDRVGTRDMSVKDLNDELILNLQKTLHDSP